MISEVISVNFYAARMSNEEDSDFYKMCLKAHGYTFLQDQTDEDKSESDEESRSMKPPPVPYRQFKHRIVKVPDVDVKTSKLNERKIERKLSLLNENKRKSNEISSVNEKVKKQTNNKAQVMQEIHLNKNNCINNESTANTLNQPSKTWLSNVEFEVNKEPVYTRIFESTQSQITPKVPESNYLFEKNQNIHTTNIQPTKTWLGNVEFEVNKEPVYTRIFESTQSQITPKVPESNYLFEKNQNIHTTNIQPTKTWLGNVEFEVNKEPVYTRIFESTQSQTMPKVPESNYLFEKNQNIRTTNIQPTKTWLSNVEFEVNKEPVYTRIFESTQSQITSKVPESNYLFEKNQNIHTYIPSVSTVPRSTFCHENIATVTNVLPMPTQKIGNLSNQNGDFNVFNVKPTTVRQADINQPQIQRASATKILRNDYQTDEAGICSIIEVPSRPNNMNTANIQTPLPISNAAVYIDVMDSVDLVFAEYQQKRKNIMKKKKSRCCVM